MPEIKHVDREKNPPTNVGAHGVAWRIDLDKARGAIKRTEEEDATVGLWVVFAPWAHMLWAYYAICVVHLRPTKLYPNPKICLPGATHEIIVGALDPREVPDLVCPGQHMLRPLNFVGQWVVQTRRNPVDQDREASTKLDSTVEEIINGLLSPDTDFRREWVKRFSASNLKDGWEEGDKIIIF